VFALINFHYNLNILYGCRAFSYSIYEFILGKHKVFLKAITSHDEGKRPLGRPRRRWEDNIKLDLREIGIDGLTGFGWLKIGSSGRLL
jgi:hypothetical protein